MKKPTKNNYSNKGPFSIYTYCFYTPSWVLTRYRVDQDFVTMRTSWGGGMRMF